MSGKQRITVVGATGAQGGPVVQIFLNDPKLKSHWTVRAITRDATKESAKKLQSQGAEVVAADVNHTETLAKVFQGSDVVFAVTNYWEKMDMQLEIQQGKNIVDAAKEAKVGLLVWSSLYNVSELSKGKLTGVFHFDSKADVEVYARKAGIPAVFFMPGVYMSNFPGTIIRPSPPDNDWTFALPVPASSPAPLLDTGDTGKFIKAIVLHRDRLLGKRVLGATAYMTLAEMLDDFKAAYPEAGRSATYTQLPRDTYKGFLLKAGMPEHGAEELTQNWELLADCGYYGGESLDASHAVVEDRLTPWKEYIKTAPAFKDLK